MPKVSKMLCSRVVRKPSVNTRRNSVSFATKWSDGVTTISLINNYPVSIAVSPTGDNAGYVYVGGYYGAVEVFAPDGTDLGDIGGSFGYRPYGLAVAPTGVNAGNIYVGSYEYGTVTMLAPDGTILDTITLGSSYYVQGLAIAP
jgi:hypothetical protein